MFTGGRSRKAQSYLAERPVFRFVVFLVFMGGVFAFGLIQLIDIFRSYPNHRVIETAVLVGAVAALVPALQTISAATRADLSAPGVRAAIAVFLVLMVLGVPNLFNWAQFAGDRYWLEVPCLTGFMVAAVSMVRLRIKQKFWSKDWKPSG